jgi:hypothetical protein
VLRLQRVVGTLLSVTDDVAKATERVRYLGTRKATPERRAEVEEALSSKWEGVQSVAAQTLGGWGGRESVDVLRRWLDSLNDRPAAWSLVGVAADALASCVGDDDVDWVVEDYVRLPQTLERHDRLAILVALPREKTTTRLRAELRSADPGRRDAAEGALRWLSQFPPKSNRSR